MLHRAQFLAITLAIKYYEKKQAKQACRTASYPRNNSYKNAKSAAMFFMTLLCLACLVARAEWCYSLRRRAICKKPL